MLFFITIKAQVQVSPTYASQVGLTPDALWQAQFNNLGFDAKQVILVAEVFQQKKLVYQRVSHPILLQAGQQSIPVSFFREKSENFYNTSLKNKMGLSRNFPSGEYEICLLVKTSDGGNELGRHCQVVSVKSPNLLNGERTQSSDRQHSFRLSGNGGLMHLYSNQPFFGNNEPRHDIRLNLNATMNINDVPIGTEIFYTTEYQQLGAATNIFNINFDAQKFQEKLRQKLEQKLTNRANQIQEAHGLDFEKEKILQQQLSEISKEDLLDFKIEQSKLESQLENYKEKELKYLERKLRKKLAEEEKEFLQKKNQILQQSDSLKQEKLDALESEHQQWLEKTRPQKERLENLQQQLHELEQLQRKLKKQQQQIAKLQSDFNQEEFTQQQFSKLKLQNDSLKKHLTVRDLSNPSQLKKRLKEEDLLEGKNHFLFMIKDLQIGTYQSNYSPLIMSGTRANGFSMAISPDEKWEFATSIGKTQSPFFGISQDNNFNQPLVVASKISFQRKNWNTYLTGAFPFQKVELSPDVINEPTNANTLLGIGGTFSLLKNKLNGAIDGASNINFNSENSALNTNLDWDIFEHLQFSGQYQTIGTEYQDIASPLLLSGMELVDLQLNSYFFKKQLMVGSFYLKDKNRPLAFSPFTFQNHQYGLQVNWQSQNLPQISARIGKNLFSQQDNNGNAYLWNLQLNYPYQFGGINCNTSMSYQHTRQQLNPQLPTQLYTFWEIRQQLNWTNSFSNTISVYSNIADQNVTNQNLKGLDLQSVFSKNKFRMDFIIGIYERANRYEFKSSLNLQLAIGKYLDLQVQGGMLPSFTQEENYLFIRSGLVSRF